MTEARGVTACHEAGAGWAAIGRGNVAVGEAQAVLGQRIDMGRRNILGKALRGDFAPTEVVGVKDNDVGRGRRAGAERAEKTKAENKTKETEFHGKGEVGRTGE